MSAPELKIGDRLKDNDPRMKWRAPLQIVEVLPNGVATWDGNTIRRVLRKRIHTDGKPRRSGFDLIRAAG